MRLGYYLRETATNLRRNFLMTIAAISTVAISLLLLGGVQILGMIVSNVTLNWEAKVEISAWLLDDITDNELQALETDIAAMPQVKSFDYVSKDDAYEEFKQLFPRNPEYWETLPKDSLPASLRISLHDADQTEEVAGLITGAPGVEDVDFGDKYIKRLLQVNSLLRTVTFIMSIILMVAAAGLIANTIRLAIYARREEISIMKLVGATNWFIRIPFMLEGVFAATVGAILAGAVVVGTNSLVFNRLGQTFNFLGSIFSFTSSEILSVLLIMLGVGALVGIIGSTMALRRFLEV